MMILQFGMLLFARGYGLGVPCYTTRLSTLGDGSKILAVGGMGWSQKLVTEKSRTELLEFRK